MSPDHEQYARLEVRLFPNQDGYFARRKGFWERQIQKDPTVPQRVYDALFGIVAPILVFVFDPVVFQNHFSRLNEGFLARYRLLVYLISSIAIFTLSLWIAGFIKKRTAFAGGILLAGAYCSSVIGLVILPISLIGLVIGIGLFGFIPFLTAIVYWRNAKRALEYQKHIMFKKSQELSVFLGLLLAVGVPLAIDYPLSRVVSSSFQVLLSQEADAQSKTEAAMRIKKLSWYLDKNRIIDDYEAEPDATRKEAIANAYAAITGSNIRAARSD